MDLVLVCIFLFPILSFIALNFLFHKVKKTSYNPNIANNLPPGSTGWPLIGETMELGMLGGKGIPELFFLKRMQKYSQDIFKTSFLGEKTAVICGASGNKLLFSNENKLVCMYWPRTVRKIFPHVEYSNPNVVIEESNKTRNMLTNFLKPGFLRNCVGIVDSVSRKHFESKWDSQKEVKTLNQAKDYTISVACKLFLSIEDPRKIEEIAKPFHVLAAGIFGIPVNLPGTAFNKGIKASRLIREKLFEIIRERKEHLLAGKSPWSDDILWDLITVSDDHGRFLNELEIADSIVAYLLASQDTTSTAITFLVKYLAEFQQVYLKVLKEHRSIRKGKQSPELNWKDLQKMKYSWNVISEVLRLMPPFPGNFREALTDFTYSGFFIPKGWKLYWTPNTTHKNPQYFSEPEKFDPSRFEGNGPVPYSYVAFGGGSHICPGKDFARIMILAFLHNLVQRFYWEKLLPNEKILVQPAPYPANGLPIRLHLHN